MHEGSGSGAHVTNFKGSGWGGKREGLRKNLEGANN